MSFLLNLIIAIDTSKTLWTTSIIIELKILEYGTGSSKKLLQDAIWVVNKKGLILWKTETSIDPIIVNKIITAIVETIGPIEFSANAEKQIDTELKGLKKVNLSADVTTRLKQAILAVNGSREKKDIREFVDNYLLAADARALRDYMRKITPDLDLTFTFMGSDGYIQEGVDLPIDASFFYPSTRI